MGIFNKFLGGNTLYYPGCLTKFVLKDIQENYKKILEKEGVDFIVLKDKEFCCGSPVKNAGADKEFEDLAKKNLKVFKDHNINRIISNCPACVAVFKNDYKETLGNDWDVEVLHITEIINSKAKSIFEDSAKKDKLATYHDPCHLGRALGIYDQPREIIKKAGYEIKEMDLSRQKSFCCGGGGGVKTNNAELSSRIAKDRIEQAQKTGAGCLITSCPMCYANLKENSEGIEVKEVSEIM
jgi:heterodisulfide reductase subunit D